MLYIVAFETQRIFIRVFLVQGQVPRTKRAQWLAGAWRRVALFHVTWAPDGGWPSYAASWTSGQAGCRRGWAMGERAV